MKIIDFEKPSIEGPYIYFPTTYEADENIYFHGTNMDRFKSIQSSCFKSKAQILSEQEITYNENEVVDSVSFGEKSMLAMKYALEYRGDNNSGVIIAVKFTDLTVKGIELGNGFLHIHDKSIQPEIIGYIIVDDDYDFI